MNAIRTSPSASVGAGETLPDHGVDEDGSPLLAHGGGSARTSALARDGVGDASTGRSTAPDAPVIDAARTPRLEPLASGSRFEPIRTEGPGGVNTGWS